MISGLQQWTPGSLADAVSMTRASHHEAYRQADAVEALTRAARAVLDHDFVSVDQESDNKMRLRAAVEAAEKWGKR